MKHLYLQSIFLLLLSIMYVPLHAQQLIDMAGNGIASFSGDGRPAVDASMNGPSSIQLDKNGMLLVADIDNHRIRIINLSTGIIQTFAGTGTPGFSGDGGPAVNASFNQPKDLWVDKQGNIFLTDYLNKRVRKIDVTSGIITTVAGNGTINFSDGELASSTGLPDANSVTTDDAGNIYISSITLRMVLKIDKATGRIRKFAGSGSAIFSGDGGLATNAGIPFPHVIRFHPDKSILISDLADNTIRKVSLSTGIIQTITGTGIPGYTGDGGPANLASINQPLDLAVDDTGNVYIADGNNHVIRKIHASTGLISTIAGTGEEGYDGPNVFYRCSRINVPVSVCWSPSGLVYMGEWVGLRIRKLDPLAVTPVNPTATLSPIPAEICPGTPLELSIKRIGGFAGEPQMQWQINGSPAGYFGRNISLPGIQNGDIISCVITGTNNTCSTSTITVSSPPIRLSDVNPVTADILGDSIICAQQDAQFTAKSNYNLKDITWTVNNQPVGLGSNFKPQYLADGSVIQYRGVVDTNGCLKGTTVFSRKMSVNVLPALVLSISPADTSIVPGGSVILVATTEPGIQQFRWTGAGLNITGGASSQTVQPTRTGTYTVSVSDDLGCTQMVTAKIKVIRPIFIPNSFTPNGDGRNDLFRVPPDIDAELISFRVFNRFGELVWQTSDSSRGWDGTVKGKIAPNGSYAYQIMVRQDQEVLEIKGTVTLIR